jgi:hypothetical protein
MNDFKILKLYVEFDTHHAIKTGQWLAMFHLK